MGGLKIQSGSFDRPIRKLRAYADNAEDMTPAWPKVQFFLAAQVTQQFATNGLRFGTGWDPLSPDYRKWKIAHGGGGTLVKTGGLKESFQGRGRYAIQVYTRDSAKFGSRHPLAHLHQDGSRGGKIPARPILVIRRDVQKGITKIVSDHITGKNV